MAAHQLEEVLAGMMGCSSNKNNIDKQLEEEEEEEKKGMSRPPRLEKALKCPRCDSTNTKFCYYNNYSLSQPRYLCKGCRRYWTLGGSLRNIPVGGGCRKDKRSPSSKKAQERRRHTHQSLAASAAAANNSNPNPSLNSSAGAGILSILRGGGGGFLDRHSNRKNRYDDNASDYADARGGNSMMRSSLGGGNISVGNATLTAGAEGYSWTNHGNNVAVESTREYYWLDGVTSYWYGLDHQ